MQELTFYKKKLPEAETIVQQQLQAFNAKNIDAFVDAFDSEVKAYDFPNKLHVQGKKELHTLSVIFFTNLFTL